MEAVPHVAVIVLTMFDDDQSVTAAIRNGARGYLLNGARQDEIRRAVRAAAAGEAIFGPTPFPQLTARELEVLDEVARGVDNATIARTLHLSEKTVRNYVSLVLTKIHATTRAEAIVLAREAGLGGAA